MGTIPFDNNNFRVEAFDKMSVEIHAAAQALSVGFSDDN
jgi:hypothetical protein